MQRDTVQSQEALAKHLELTEKIRVAAGYASAKAAEKSVHLSLKKRPPTVYSVGDDVIVHTAAKKWKQLNKSISVPIIAEGQVVATDEKKLRYRIALGAGKTEWYAVSNITSLTLQEEQKTRKKQHKAQGIVDHLNHVTVQIIILYCLL